MLGIPRRAVLIESILRFLCAVPRALPGRRQKSHIVPGAHCVREGRFLTAHALGKRDRAALHVLFRMEVDVKPRRCAAEVQKYLVDYHIHGIMAIIQDWVQNDCREDISHITEIIIYCVRPNKGAEERINRIIDQIKPDVSIGIEISTKQIYRIMNNENFQDIEQLYLKPNDIYYIIFTSGSTGIPKGVKVTYENLNSCIHWLKDITEMEKGVILNQANYSFDLSVADLYLSLITESEHFIVNTSRLDFEKMFNELNKRKKR